MCKPQNVLLIEDEVMIALNIEDTVARLGYTVQTAPSVKQARLLLDENGVDLAIVDYKVSDG